MIRSILGLGRKPDDEPAFWWENPPRYLKRRIVRYLFPSLKLAEMPRVMRWLARW